MQTTPQAYAGNLRTAASQTCTKKMGSVIISD